MRLLLFLLVASPLGAQSSPPPPPLVTDRPDQTESASVVPTGALQVEAGTLFERTGSGPARVEGMALGGTLLRYGLARRLELRLGFDGWVREDVAGGGPVPAVTDGFGDLEAGFKLALLAPDAPVELAVLGGATLPVGTDALSTGRVEPAGRLALAVPLTPVLGFGANAGAFRSGGRTDGLYSAVFGLGLTDRVAVFAESFGTVPISSGGAAAHALDGGVTVLLGPTLQLDASGGVGLNAAAADWFVGAGLSLRLGG